MLLLACNYHFVVFDFDLVFGNFSFSLDFILLFVSTKVLTYFPPVSTSDPHDSERESRQRTWMDK